MSFHTCVWMDHREAIILELTRESVESSRVRYHGPEQHLHRKADHVGHGSTGLDEGFMAELAGKLTAAKAILIVGPGEAKTGFKAWLEHKHPAIAANNYLIVGRFLLKQQPSISRCILYNIVRC